MKLTPTTILLSIALLLGGCAQIGGTKFKRSYLSIKDAQDQTIGTILVWEADTSAAILFKDGGACMQTALAVKTTDFQAQAKFSDALLTLSKTAAAVAVSPGATTNQPLADVTSSIKEAAQLLTTTTERTAFLNIGMFYLCQIAANKSLSQGESDVLLDALIKAAAGMK